MWVGQVVEVTYHFWEHPGRQIMDGLSKDAQGGENKHNPEDNARTAMNRRQNVREQQAHILSFHCSKIQTNTNNKELKMKKNCVDMFL